MMRSVWAVLLVFALGTPAAAQEETLADIRQELSVLWVEIQRLRGELNTTGAPSGSGSGGGTLERLDAIEGELRRLTNATEELQIRVDRVASDGTRQIRDLEFRLCELESDCDISSLGETPQLGGGSTVVAQPPQPTTTTATSLATNEQDDFDRAMSAYEAGDFAAAAAAFEAFTNTYPGGGLSSEAHFWRGESEAAQGQWSRAARAYLASFSGAPSALRAPQSLLRLGTSLGELGQRDEACITLAEVGIRYPGTPSVAEASAAMARLGCN